MTILCDNIAYIGYALNDIQRNDLRYTDIGQYSCNSITDTCEGRVQRHAKNQNYESNC